METLTAGDESSLKVTLTDTHGVATSPTSATLYWRIGSGAAQSSPMQVAGNVVSYRFQPAELTPGVVKADVTVVASGYSYSIQNPIVFRVRRRT